MHAAWHAGGLSFRDVARDAEATGPAPPPARAEATGIAATAAGASGMSAVEQEYQQAMDALARKEAEYAKVAAANAKYHIARGKQHAIDGIDLAFKKKSTAPKTPSFNSGFNDIEAAPEKSVFFGASGKLATAVADVVLTQNVTKVLWGSDGPELVPDAEHQEYFDAGEVTKMNLQQLQLLFQNLVANGLVPKRLLFLMQRVFEILGNSVESEHLSISRDWCIERQLLHQQMWNRKLFFFAWRQWAQSVSNGQRSTIKKVGR